MFLRLHHTFCIWYQAYIYTHIELSLQDTATFKTAFESQPQQYHLAFPTSCVRKEVGETTPEKVGSLNQLQSIEWGPFLLPKFTNRSNQFQSEHPSTADLPHSTRKNHKI